MRLNMFCIFFFMLNFVISQGTVALTPPGNVKFNKKEYIKFCEKTSYRYNDANYSSNNLRLLKLKDDYFLEILNDSNGVYRIYQVTPIVFIEHIINSTEDSIILNSETANVLGEDVCMPTEIQVYTFELMYNGVCREYYDDGTLKIKGRYKDNERHGRWIYYTPNKKKHKIEKYKNGGSVKLFLRQSSAVTLH